VLYQLTSDQEGFSDIISISDDSIVVDTGTPDRVGTWEITLHVTIDGHEALDPLFETTVYDFTVTI
jgi:hypothetical protein